jgi:hypothetical protein
MYVPFLVERRVKRYATGWKCVLAWFDSGHQVAFKIVQTLG